MDVQQLKGVNSHLAHGCAAAARVRSHLAHRYFAAVRVRSHLAHVCEVATLKISKDTLSTRQASSVVYPNSNKSFIY